MGGAETQVCNLADQYVLLGHKVLLVCLTGDVVNRPKSDNVQIFNLQMSKTFFGFINGIIKAKRIVKEFSPDIVHSHMVHANLFSRILRIFIRIPRLISTSHNSYEGGVLRMLAYRITDKLSDMSTNVSKQAVFMSVARHAVPASKIVVQYNGVDTSIFHKDKYDTPKIRVSLGLLPSDIFVLAVGRLTAAKDFENLLNAMFQLNKSNVKLFIAGAGELDHQLKTLVTHLDLQNKVSFLGLRSDIPELMSAADIFVLSSEWEGFPMVIGEAMSSECIVVSTNAGGSKEWFDDALASDYVVNIKDSMALSNAIKKVLSLSDDERKEIVRISRKRILDKFSLNKIAEQWLTYYQ